MLSLDITADPPSCSHKVDGLKSDGRDHPKCPASEEVELLKHDHAFSIREYVLTSRSKDIQVNWPFSDKFLHLCLKHGVREVLPPFEPVAAVRRDLSVTIPGAELDCQEALVAESERNKGAERKDVTLLGSEANGFGHKLDEPLVSRSLGSTDRIPSLASEKDDSNKPVKEDRRSIERSPVSLCQKESVVEETTASIVTTDAQTRVNSDFLSKNKLPAVPASKNIKLSKASLVVCDKTQSQCEQSEQKRRLIVKFAGEGIVPDPSAAVTEPMASKICPVCKTFSSTSNTTLNAHIDQCLAAESASRMEVAGTSRVFKGKPRKMRSMVDICATARRCTLEELERRNGMSCATAPSTDELPGGNGHAAQTKRPPPEFFDDGREVYVDSSGTKVRLLSRFNDVPTVVAGEGGAKPRKLGKLMKGIFPGKEQLSFRGHKAHKKGKILEKKLGLLKHHDAETLKGSKAKEVEKEDSLSELLKTRESVATTEDCRTLQKWASCKRSAPSKKNKDLMPPTIINENSRLSSGSYAREECHLQGNSSLQQDRYTSSHTDTGGSHDSAGDWEENSIDICLSNVHTPAKGRPKTSAHSMLNGAISSGTCISSRRCPRPETHGKSDRNPLTTMDRDVSSFKSAYSRKSPRLMELKNSHVEDRNTPKKSRRLIVESGQGLQQLPNQWVEPLSSSCGDSGNDQRLCHLKNIMREEAKGFREDYQIQNESGFSLDEELQSPGSTNHVSHDSYSGGAGDLNIDTRKPVSRNSPSDADLKADSCESVDEQTIPVSANEGGVAPVSYSSCDEQEVRLSDVSTVVSSQTAETNLRNEGECLQRIQQNKCGDFAEPELCLPSYEDIGYQVFHANSSAHVGNPQTIPKYQLLNSHSLPPCSAAIWQPAISTTPPALQGKQSFIDRAGLTGAVHGEENHTFPSSSTTVAGERTKLGRESLRVSIPPNYLSKFPDDQPCCCSRKESVSRTYHGSNISRQNFVSNLPMLKGKQMTSSLNSSNRMGAFTSFGTPSAPHVDPFMVESPMSRVKSASAFRNITSTEAFDVPSPSSLAHAQSAPSPVLRLMGKNLMVMNKDTDVPVQDHKTVLPNDNSNANYLKLLGFSAGSAFNSRPSTGRNLSSSPSNSCAGYSNISRNFGNHKYMQSSGLTTHDFSAQRFTQPKVKADALVQPKRIDRNNSSPAGLTYEMIEKPQCLRPAATDHITDSPREVIVIDDFPEVEVDRHGTCGLSGPKSYQPVLGGMLLHPSAANSNSGSIRFTSTQVPHVMAWRQC